MLCSTDDRQEVKKINVLKLKEARYSSVIVCDSVNFHGYLGGAGLSAWKDQSIKDAVYLDL